MICEPSWNPPHRDGRRRGLGLDDLKLSIEIIRQASEQGDHERYRNEAHAIKGASANIGANEVFKIARIANDDSEAEFKEYSASRHKDLCDALRNVEAAFKKLNDKKHISTDTLKPDHFPVLWKCEIPRFTNPTTSA